MAWREIHREPVLVNPDEHYVIYKKKDVKDTITHHFPQLRRDQIRVRIIDPPKYGPTLDSKTGRMIWPTPIRDKPLAIAIAEIDDAIDLESMRNLPPNPDEGGAGDVPIGLDGAAVGSGDGAPGDHGDADDGSGGADGDAPPVDDGPVAAG